MASIHNDISLIYNLLQEIFRSFFCDDSMSEFNNKAFNSFEGINNKQFEQIKNDSFLYKTFDIELSPYEVFMLLAAISPFHLPDVYRGAHYLKRINEESFAIVGGKVSGDNKCFYPTGETILFLLGGHNITKRLQFEDLFMPHKKLFFNNLIILAPNETGTPRLSGKLYPTPELLTRINGQVYHPEYSAEFPASPIETKMEWEDLILPYETHEELDELKIWMKHGSKLSQHPKLGKRIKPGYKTLFYGPPGTGKTLTASLIGKNFGVDVFRIDLSMLVSKWVGETEKNLKNIFDQASNKNWILFFDEADAIFGKRTSTNSSNDRYANQEVSYLLQRIEEFPGLVILASNLKSNIDEAFNRRFQSSILFPMPSAEIRYFLWEKAFPKDFPLETNINLHNIAEKYELAGGAIINVVRFCALMAMERNNHKIMLEDIEHAIIREFRKEGKIVS